MNVNTKKRTAFAVRSLFSGLFLIGVLASAQVFAQQQQPQFVPQAEDPDSYPDGPGRDDAFYACAGCHAFRVVANQGLSRERWDETISYMTERHGMQKLEGKDRELILNYLAKTYPPKTQPGFQNPFLKR